MGVSGKWCGYSHVQVQVKNSGNQPSLGVTGKTANHAIKERQLP